MTPDRKRYRVAMYRWDVYVQWFEAASQAEALALAEGDYDENLDDNWKHKDGNVTSFDIWEEVEIGGQS